MERDQWGCSASYGTYGAPLQRIIQPKTAIVLRLSNPALVFEKTNNGINHLSSTMCWSLHFTYVTTLQSWFPFGPLADVRKDGTERGEGGLPAPDTRDPEQLTAENRKQPWQVYYTLFTEVGIIWQMKTGRSNFREIRYPGSLSCYQNRVPISIRSKSNSDR